MIEKYSEDVFKNINKDNMNKIIKFLNDNNCDYIEELLEDYWDIFTIDYNDFVNKFNKLNEKYNNNYINLISEDMNLLEELFY